MGDLHNLFGSVNEAHVYLDPDEPDGFYIEETIPGFSIGRVLGNVQYEPSQLSRMIKGQVTKRLNRTNESHRRHGSSGKLRKRPLPPHPI